MITPKLETERLLLREIQLHDTEEIFNCWMQDEDVSRYMWWKASKDINDAREFTAYELGNLENDKWFRWIIVLKSTHEIIGTCLIYFDDVKNLWDISYNLGKQFWGLGYATEAMGAVLKFAAKELNISEIFAAHAVENPASGRVLRKLGFQYEKDIPFKCNGGDMETTGKYYRYEVKRNRSAMNQNNLSRIIEDQTNRALWEVKNVIDCVSDKIWNTIYCDMPCWKHIYHMLHSLDLWFINPNDPNYQEPSIHEKDLNNLDIVSDKILSREELDTYFTVIEKKIRGYVSELTDQHLLEYPIACDYCKFTLILAQFRHLHSHMGMIMGFIIRDTGLWPRVLGLENPFPEGDYEKYL